MGHLSDEGSPVLQELPGTPKLKGELLLSWWSHQQPGKLLQVMALQLHHGGESSQCPGSVLPKTLPSPFPHRPGRVQAITRASGLSDLLLLGQSPPVPKLMGLT